MARLRESVWSDPGAAAAALLMIHGRGHEHAIKNVAYGIARADELSAFRARATPNRVAIIALLEAHAHDSNEAPRQPKKGGGAFAPPPLDV